MPTGAFLYTCDLTPLLKFSSEKFETAPFGMFCPKYGSQRSPTFRVTRCDSLHESWPNTPRYR